MESYSVGIKPSFTDGFKVGVELKMLRFPLDVTKMDKIINEYNRRAKLSSLVGKVREAK